MIETDQTCPCSSGLLFANCCEPIIKGERESETAEQLMRARYSAFATGAIEFIVATTHSSTRLEVDIPEIREWSESSTWQGLQIIDIRQVDAGQTFLSFEARFTQRGKQQQHREMSQFEREDGKWRFVTGEQLKNPTVRYETPRTGRNEPCPCGSGKKYKKCCGA
jgi:SEC-C motif domain protein